jgi:hypothetical protein
LPDSKHQLKIDPPQTVGPETGKWVRYVALGGKRHYRGPVSVKNVEQSKGWFEKILSNFSLGDKVQD